MGTGLNWRRNLEGRIAEIAAAHQPRPWRPGAYLNSQGFESAVTSARHPSVAQPMRDGTSRKG
jgi:hypothetical protein